MGTRPGVRGSSLANLKRASLGEIGEVLRHRSMDSTAIYAKVQLGALKPLALDWPEGMELIHQLTLSTIILNSVAG